MRSLLLIVLLAVGLAACGSDEAPSGDAAAREATELAQQTRELAGEVARTGRSAVEDPGAAADARERLRELEDQAREQARRAEDLPQSTNVREELRRTNERIAEAAARLERADPSERVQALEEARSRLRDARNGLGDVADRLEGQLPEGAREDLESLRDQLP